MVHAWSWGLLSFSGFPVPGEIRKQLPPAPPSERFESHKCRILGFDIEALMKKLKLHYSSFLLTPNTVYTPRKNELFCRPRAACSETYEASAFAAKMSFTSRYSSSCQPCLLNSKKEAKNSADTFTTLFYGINRQSYLNIFAVCYEMGMSHRVQVWVRILPPFEWCTPQIAPFFSPMVNFWTYYTLLTTVTRNQNLSPLSFTGWPYLEKDV